LIFGKFLS